MSDATEATLLRELHCRHVRRLRRMYAPVGAYGETWCATMLALQRSLRADGSRLDVDRRHAAYRSLAGAVAGVLSRSAVYDRVRAALDAILRDVRASSLGRFSVSEVLG